MVKVYLLEIFISEMVVFEVDLINAANNYTGIALKERRTEIARVESGIRCLNIVMFVVQRF